MQNSSIDALMALIAQLFPLIMTVIMITLVLGLVAGISGKKKRGGILGIIFLLFLIASPLTTLVSATASVSPGSTTVYDFMPTNEVFRGLSTGGVVEYQIRRGDATTVELDDLYADSNGVLIVQVTPYQEDANSFVLYNVTGSATLISFTVVNNSIMDYMIPLFTIAIMISILTLILGIFTGKKR